MATHNGSWPLSEYSSRLLCLMLDSSSFWFYCKHHPLILILICNGYAYDIYIFLVILLLSIWTTSRCLAQASLLILLYFTGSGSLYGSHSL